MNKIVKTVFRCDFCNRDFKDLNTCLKHETLCKVKTLDCQRLTSYLQTLISHYHNKGYEIEIRYSDKYDNDLIVDLKQRK